MSATFVLDCSVAASWCFEDESSIYADAVLSSLKHAKALVPSLWQLEVANVLLMAEKRKRISEADALHFSSHISQLPIEIDEASASMTNLFLLARTHQLTAYDASYLMLSLIYGLPLATLDEKLKSAAKEAGVNLYLHELLH